MPCGPNSSNLRLRDQALDGAPAPAVGPFPASRRPIGTELGALNSRAFWSPNPATLDQTVLRAAPEPPRSLAVGTSVSGTEVLRRGSGEGPVGIWMLPDRHCAQKPPSSSCVTSKTSSLMRFEIRCSTHCRKRQGARMPSSLARSALGGLGNTRETAWPNASLARFNVVAPKRPDIADIEPAIGDDRIGPGL